MSAEAKGAYIDMLCYSWMNETIRDDDGLARSCGASPEVCRTVLDDKWHEHNGEWRNERLEKERQYTIDRSDLAKASVSHRVQRSLPQLTSSDERAMNERSSSDERAIIERSSSDHLVRSQMLESESEVRSETIEARDQNTDSLEPRRKRARKQADDTAMHWSIFDGWQRTEQHRDMWAAAYPAVDIDLALAQAHAWLIGHPTKAHKSNWVRFVTTWMSKDQDRGGSAQSTSRPYGAQRPMESNF